MREEEGVDSSEEGKENVVKGNQAAAHEDNDEGDHLYLVGAGVWAVASRVGESKGQKNDFSTR